MQCSNTLKGLKVKLRRVESIGRLEEKVNKVRKRIAAKMATQPCFVEGCNMSFNGTDDEDGTNSHSILTFD